MPPDHAGDSRTVVARLISVVGRRRWFQHVAFALALAGAAGALVAVIASLTRWESGVAPARITVACVAGAVAMVFSSRGRTRRSAAAAIERAQPACRNLVVTAEELERRPAQITPGMADRVFSDAARAVSGLRAADVVPLGRAFLALLLAVAAVLAASSQGRTSIQRALAPVSRIIQETTAAPQIRITVTPPAYAVKPPVRLTNPERIDALEGSLIRFDIPATSRVRFGNAEPATELVARESGYFAVESPDAGGRRLLIPLSVTRDRAPSVRIEAPGKDLLLPDGGGMIPLAITASDDLGLEALELRYTKVSGTGEQFEFVEGSLPVTVRRTSVRDWRAQAQLALASLRLEPGDSVVYRAVARDRRPGDAGLADSDTYFVEIAGPGQVALAGVDMPPQLERYAMSQQMIVLKLERLRAKEAALARPAVVEEAQGIAAEQRTVRANFVFLLGGHVEDEEVEAEQSHEIQEGRLENTARKDINAAISHMTRAEQGLVAVNTGAALPPARAAVEALQRAFGHRRYLLRSLPVRSRVDPSRRLTGDLDDAGHWRRISPDAAAREGEAARRMLERLLEAAEEVTAGRRAETARMQQLAEAALSIAPSSSLWQGIARSLLDARDAEALEKVIEQVSPESRRGAVPRTPLSTIDSPLVRAFAAERRR